MARQLAGHFCLVKRTLDVSSVNKAMLNTARLRPESENSYVKVCKRYSISIIAEVERALYSQPSPSSYNYD